MGFVKAALMVGILAVATAATAQEGGIHVRSISVPPTIERGAAGVWWPIWSSKPAGRGSPTVGWFDSIAAP